MNINLSSLFLRNLLKALSIKQADCVVGCEEVLQAEISKLHKSLEDHLKRCRQQSNRNASVQIKNIYNLYKSSTKSNTGGISTFSLYKKLRMVCQYIGKNVAISSDEYILLKEICESEFLDIGRYRTGLDVKTIQRILKPEVSTHINKNHFEKLEFIITTVLPQMSVAPDFIDRLNQLFTTEEDIVETLFTYDGRFVQFEGIDSVTEILTHWNKSVNCATGLGQIVKKLDHVVVVAESDSMSNDNDSVEFVLDEAGFHKNSHDLFTSQLAMFNIEIPTASLSEFNRNIYQIISNTVYPFYINYCRETDYRPNINSWKEGFNGDPIAASLVLHGLHMDLLVHQSFCKKLVEIAELGKGAK